ncbi:hypothetical protein WICPIJ_009029 [Wickerhamomyces pijperi]|uniref:Uncharacterized protein n=1 Tax=Wickerhamomyces pijperi TaxID=599730 RepID=A0A9P8PT85_WICPI|nr:hypothetical protein WICPIJ_009029 [Wickerhamomyces pijperi]
MHGLQLDHEPGVDKHSQQEETRDGIGSSSVVTESSNGLEQSSDGFRGQSQEQQVDEELAWFSGKIGQEVDENVEENQRAELKWETGEHTSENLSGRVEERVRLLFHQDRSLGKLSSHSSQPHQRVVQHHEEHNTTSGERTSCGWRSVVVKRTGNQGLDHRSSTVNDLVARVTESSLETSGGKQLQLLEVRDGVSVVDLVLLQGQGLVVDVSRLITVGLALVLLNLFQKFSVQGRLSPSLFEIIGGLWSSVLEPRSHNTALHIGDSSQVLSGGLSSWTFEPQVNEVLLSCFSLPKEHLTTFVQHQHLVETFVDGLTSLVNGDKGNRLGQVGGGSDSLGILQGSGSIEPSGGVVPTVNSTLSRHGFSNGHSLSLTTRNTTDVIVTNLGVESMRQPKDRGVQVSVGGDVGLSGGIVDTGVRRLTTDGESQRLVNGQMRIMDVQLTVVDDVRLVLAHHLLLWDPVVMDVTFNAGELVLFTSNGFQQRRTTGTWSP